VIRWVAWTVAPSDDTRTQGALMRGPGTKAHATKLDGVGGHGGVAGRALCGVTIPADNPDHVLAWYDGGARCARCASAAKGRAS
jgi:hypothetical protein